MMALPKQVSRLVTLSSGYASIQRKPGEELNVAQILALEKIFPRWSTGYWRSSRPPDPIRIYRPVKAAEACAIRCTY